uniref:Uncharacterized protein n=1 Tax=Oryza barthii TaxID=65489 RepID=A0A0D3EMP0_9ORYZ
MVVSTGTFARYGSTAGHAGDEVVPLPHRPQLELMSSPSAAADGAEVIPSCCRRRQTPPLPQFVHKSARIDFSFPARRRKSNSGGSSMAHRKSRGRGRAQRDRESGLWPLIGAPWPIAVDNVVGSSTPNPFA